MQPHGHTTTERRVCFRNDCDALFTPAHLRQQQREWPADPRPQLIITAGPERSGSTWLYNAGGWAACRAALRAACCARTCCSRTCCCCTSSCTAVLLLLLLCAHPACPPPCAAVRLLFQHARKPLDAYWVKDVTDTALDARRVGGWVGGMQPGAGAPLGPARCCGCRQPAQAGQCLPACAARLPTAMMLNSALSALRPLQNRRHAWRPPRPDQDPRLERRLPPEPRHTQ